MWTLLVLRLLFFLFHQVLLQMARKRLACLQKWPTQLLFILSPSNHQVSLLRLRLVLPQLVLLKLNDGRNRDSDSGMDDRRP